MSYARSPRPVCSMTMGTSIMRASFSLTSHTPARKIRDSGGIGKLRLSGLTVQKIEGLFVADPVPDSIQRSITCQTSADRIGRLISLRRQRFYLTVNFVVAYFDFFFVSDFFEQQSGLDFLHRLIALPCPDPWQIHFLHGLGRHAL